MAELLKSKFEKYEEEAENARLSIRMKLNADSLGSLFSVDKIKETIKEEAEIFINDIRKEAEATAGMTMPYIKAHFANETRLAELCCRYANEKPRNIILDSSSEILGWNMNQKNDALQELITILSERDQSDIKSFWLLELSRITESMKKNFWQMEITGSSLYLSLKEKWNLTETIYKKFFNTKSNQSGTIDSSWISQLKETEASESVIPDVTKIQLSGKETSLHDNINALMEILKATDFLSDNYSKNKNMEKKLAADNAIRNFNERCIKSGFDTSIAIKPETYHINSHSVVFSNPTLFDSINGKERTDAVIYNLDDTERNKSTENQENMQTISEIRQQYPEVEYLPEAGYAWISSSYKEDSEILRLKRLIDFSAKDCSYDPEKSIYSRSTEESGAIIFNTGYSGNSKEEIIESIKNINGGKRL